jgi:hypothetical protein
MQLLVVHDIYTYNEFRLRKFIINFISELVPLNDFGNEVAGFKITL